MTERIQLFAPLNSDSAIAPHRIWVRTEASWAGAAPDAVPRITISHVADGPPPTWTEDVDDVQMLNAVDDTATVNGALYYYEWTPGNENRYTVLVTATIGAVPVDESAIIEVDPAYPSHTHDGIDSPRVWWEDLKDRPEDLVGLQESSTPLTIVDDSASEQEHGLREAPVRERGVGETAASARAGVLLADHAPLQREATFVADLPSRPVKGQLLRFLDHGITLRVSRVEDLDDGRYRITAGTFRGDVFDVERREQQRIKNLERYR